MKYTVSVLCDRCKMKSHYDVNYDEYDDVRFRDIIDSMVMLYPVQDKQICEKCYLEYREIMDNLLAKRKAIQEKFLNG